MMIKKNLKELGIWGLVIASLCGAYKAGSSNTLDRARYNLLEASLHIHSLENSMRLTEFEIRHLEIYSRILNNACKIVDTESSKQYVEDIVERELKDVKVEKQLYCK